MRRGGGRGRQKTAATGLAGSTRLWKVGDRSARGVGWGAVGLDKKRQAERTGLNNQGWALASPGDPVFTHLGSAIASWTLLPLLCEESPACLGSATDVCAGYHPRLVSCSRDPWSGTREPGEDRDPKRRPLGLGEAGAEWGGGDPLGGGNHEAAARGGSSSAERWGSFAGV